MEDGDADNMAISRVKKTNTESLRKNLRVVSAVSLLPRSDMTDAPRNIASRTSALSRWYAMPSRRSSPPNRSAAHPLLLECTPDRLQFVAFLRFFSVILGYCYPDTLSENVFAAALDQATPLQSRTFAIWTTTSCMLCLLCARNIGNRQLYAATFGSFVIALGYFLLEHLVYETVPLKRAMQPLVVASVSILWMGAGFNYYTDYVHSMPAFSEEVTTGGDNKTD